MKRVEIAERSGGNEVGEKTNGFTLIELIIVIAIFAMVALVAVPMFSSAGSVQIHAAARMIAMDLEYAKSMAISGPGLRRSEDPENRSISTLIEESGEQRVTVVFDTKGESYQIFREQKGELTVIEHPVRRGFDYEINFRTDGRLDKVDIVSVDFDGTNKVKFDCLGSPYNGNGKHLNSGSIKLRAGETTTTIRVGAVTGYVSIE